MLLVAICAHILAGRSGTELGRGPVLVGAANKQDRGARLTAEPCMHIGGQQRADQIAEMLNAVDVGNGAGDEIAGHGSHPSARTPNPEKSKGPSAGTEELGFGTYLARTRVNPSGQLPCGWAGAFDGQQWRSLCAWPLTSASLAENQLNNGTTTAS